MNKSRARVPVPIAITSVAPSLDDQYEARRRKYLVMMGLRILCVIAAVLTYTISLVLALAFIVAGAVLPWCAVLIANDRPPKKAGTFVRFRAPNAQRQLEAGKPSASNGGASKQPGASGAGASSAGASSAGVNKSGAEQDA